MENGSFKSINGIAVYCLTKIIDSETNLIILATPQKSVEYNNVSSLLKRNEKNKITELSDFNLKKLWHHGTIYEKKGAFQLKNLLLRSFTEGATILKKIKL